jgi:hypothetical protein
MAVAAEETARGHSLPPDAPDVAGPDDGAVGRVGDVEVAAIEGAEEGGGEAGEGLGEGDGDVGVEIIAASRVHRVGEEMEGEGDVGGEGLLHRLVAGLGEEDDVAVSHPGLDGDLNGETLLAGAGALAPLARVFLAEAAASAMAARAWHLDLLGEGAHLAGLEVEALAPAPLALARNGARLASGPISWEGG